jgi:hypothetical protein
MTENRGAPPREQDECCCGVWQRERKIDEALAETFPASDPPAFVQSAPRHEQTK